MFGSHLGGVVPGERVVVPAVSKPFDDGRERAGKPGPGIDGVQFAGLDQCGDYGPVFSPAFGPAFGPCEEGILSVQGDGADRALDGNVVDFCPAIGQKAA